MMDTLRLRSLLVLGVSAAALMATTPAFAQGSAPSSGPAIGDIVVTAQRKSESIQDVPVAVSAFSQDTLKAQRLDGGDKLVLSVPNVNYSRGNFGGYNFQIRGIGTKGTGSTSGDAGIGVHENDVPLVSNNLGDAKSLATHPSTTTHRSMTEDQRLEVGVTEGCVRLSVGLEGAEDLVRDISRALDAA